MAQYPVGPQVTQVWAGGGPVLLANQDLNNPVTVGRRPNVTPDAADADVIPPLGSIAYGPGPTLYAIAAAGTVALLAIAGGTSWAPSPADVALQIAELGLAKDTTVSGLPAGIQSAGVPPFIPNLQSAQALQIGPSSSPTTLVTFNGGAGRIWAVHLSFAISANASHTGNDQAYCRLYKGSGTTLTVIEVAAGGPGGADSGDSDLVFNGFAIALNDNVKIDVNGGNGISQCIFRGSAVVLYSVP